MLFRRKKEGKGAAPGGEELPDDERLRQESAAPVEDGTRVPRSISPELEEAAYQAAPELERPGDVSSALISLGQSLGMRVVRLKDYQFTAETRDLIDRDYALKYRVLPLKRENGKLIVAFEDPHNFQALDDLSNIYNDLQIEQVIAEPSEVGELIERYYRNNALLVSQILEETKKEEGVKQAEEATLTVEQLAGDTLEGDLDEGRIKQLVDLILRNAYKERASDIHFECYEREFRVRFRIDGVLHDRESPGPSLKSAIITRLKLMSGMDLAEKRIPQDGRIALKIEGKTLDFRVSALPSIQGESIVLRLLETSSVMRGLEEIGFLPENVKTFYDLIR